MFGIVNSEMLSKHICSQQHHTLPQKPQLQNDFPNISLGTVYRNLNFLVDHGEALRLDMGDGNDHFDGNVMPHNHFFCRKCHHVLDLEMDGINHIDVIANAGFDGIIEGHTIYFTGLCPDCAQAKMP